MLQKSELPGIIGAVDGCHINVIVPDEVQNDYINRKFQHSMNLMAIVDDLKRFRFISAGECGKSHDAHVFQKTHLWMQIENGNAD